ncbi:hypothetical protein GCM10008013_38420 [Paenibacillus segetis]|uniref:Phr family secreted Rap phosphatase inhibitor n=1 Tax=Paenibacillus segetis TaxID=1325360 RepID=A0ABQ1YQK4_9BACL|nr:hypothetical protein GCM10008013_38420 [Paenibacillus segetis]
MMKKMALLLTAFSVMFVITLSAGTSEIVPNNKTIKLLEHGAGGY